MRIFPSTGETETFLKPPKKMAGSFLNVIPISDFDHWPVVQSSDLLLQNAWWRSTKPKSLGRFVEYPGCVHASGGNAVNTLRWDRVGVGKFAGFLEAEIQKVGGSWGSEVGLKWGEYRDPKTNSEFTPENGWLEYKPFLLGRAYFQGLR